MGSIECYFCLEISKQIMTKMLSKIYVGFVLSHESTEETTTAPSEETTAAPPGNKQYQ